MKVLRKIGKIVAFICALGIFVCLLAIMLITTTRNLVTKDNLTHYIKDANILDMKVNTFLDIDEDITMKEKITQMAYNIGIPKDIVKDILKSQELDELLGEFFSHTIDYVLNGGVKPTLTKETVEKINHVALESSANHINIVLDDETLTDYIEEYTKQIGDLIPERFAIIESENAYAYLHEILNYNIVYLYITAAILTVLTGFLTWNSYKPIKYLAIPMIVAGVIFTIIGSSDGILNSVITTKIGGIKAIISPLVTNILTVWFKCGIIVSFSGILLLVIYAVIARITKHNEFKKLEL